ncbi:MAG: PorT family protein [Saprospiraceae bacterium]|nr:PorT family protein [Saprospiraceae bacterium]MDW8484532.1 outer membrane beta-barrel protein [Saprospiraceae bacterium]
MKGIVVFVIGLLSVQQLCLAQSKPAGRPAPQKQPTGWHVGLSFGSINNAVEMDFSDRPFWRYNYVERWQYPGLEVHYSLAPRVLATFGLNVIQRGQRVETIQKFADYQDYTLVRTYLNIPVGIAVELFDTKFSPFVKAGMYGAYWLSGKWTGKVPRILDNPYDENYDPGQFTSLDFEAPYEFSENDDTGITENRLDFGFWAGGGLKYRIKSGLRLFASFDAMRGLSSIYTTTREVRDFQKRKNVGYLLSIGLTIPINRKI